ncbi:MAG: hypothetical protein WDN31_01345 [Hyphomicrobium sp.]
MRLRRMLPTLLLACALSVAIAILAAARRSELTLALAAFLFVLQVVLALLRINVPLWRSGGGASDAGWAWDNSALTALTYAWAAAVLLTVYPLGGLVWRHWWQYGLGMALLGVGTLVVAGYLIGSRPPHSNGRGLRRLMGMTVALSACVIASLVYLVASGKLATPKDDWAANVVFIAGGATVLIISLISLQTYRGSGAG